MSISYLEYLPLGQNGYRDLRSCGKTVHPLTQRPIFEVTNFTFSPNSNELFFNETFLSEAAAEFAANKSGPLTIASGNAGFFLPLTVIAPDTFQQIADKYKAQDPAAYLPPGTDSTVVAGYQAQQKAHVQAMRGSGSALYNFFFHGSDQDGGPVYLHPLSRGTVTINPEDAYFSQPSVDYRSLSNPADLDVLVEFTYFTRRFFLHTSLRNYAPVETWPGANVTAPADIITAMRNFLIPSTYHPIGTAAMMPRNLGGVVGEDLLVYGVEGLSVVDASVMPDMPGAYTQQTVYAIAEKVSPFCRRSRKSTPSGHQEPARGAHILTYDYLGGRPRQSQAVNCSVVFSRTCNGFVAMGKYRLMVK